MWNFSSSLVDHVHIYFDMKEGEYFVRNAWSCA